MFYRYTVEKDGNLAEPQVFVVEAENIAQAAARAFAEQGIYVTQIEEVEQ